MDFNPLHFDEDYMKEQFDETKFRGVIMHGMQNFAMITHTLTDWLTPQANYHRRLETALADTRLPGWRSPSGYGETETGNGR